MDLTNLVNYEGINTDDPNLKKIRIKHGELKRNEDYYMLREALLKVNFNTWTFGSRKLLAKHLIEDLKTHYWILKSQIKDYVKSNIKYVKSLTKYPVRIVVDREFIPKHEAFNHFLMNLFLREKAKHQNYIRKDNEPLGKIVEVIGLTHKAFNKLNAKTEYKEYWKLLHE